MENGDMKVQISLTIEGPAKEVTEKLVEVIKVLPREQQIEAAREFEKKLRTELDRKPRT